MKLLKQVLLASLLIYVCIQIVIILPRHLREEKGKVPFDTTQEKKSEQILQGVHLVESQPKGARDWELLADKAVTGKQAGDWDLQTVTVHFYKKEEKEFTVKGDVGKIDSKTKNISVRGHVSITSFNGYIFTTDEVFYKSADRTIDTQSPIEVVGPKDQQGDGITMTGVGLHAEVDTSKMYILDNVSAHKKMKDGKDVDVKSHSAVLNGREKEVFFKGNAHVTYENMAINSPEAMFKYTDDFLEEIVFSGGVAATQGARKATSQQLLVRVKEQKLVFKGNPVLMENDDELRGDQITLLDGGRRVKVEKLGNSKDKP